MSVPALQTLPPGLVSLGDHEVAARSRIDEKSWAYLNGGAGDENSVRDNGDAWRRLALTTRVLRPLAGGHTRLQLLGRTLAHPVLVAPVAFQRLAHPDGELATAYAAAALEAGMVLSTASSVPLEAIAKAYLSDAQRGPLWFQLYLQHDRGFNRELVQRAAAAGFEALVLTVDAPVTGVRDSERRTAFALPADVHAVHLASLRPPVAAALRAGQSALFDGLLAAAPTWSDMEWLRAETPLPVLLKGVLHPDDALQAVRSGAGGVVVSNHGGRTLDTVVPTASALPAIVQVVEGKVPVLVDGGIRRGTDVLKALALGADAVLIGRPIVHGLANAGAQGVAHVLRLLRDELEVAMALTGCATLADIGPDVLFGRHRPLG